MEKVDFQKRAVVALLGKIAEACGKAGVNPNITVSTRRSVTCFQLRRRGKGRVSLREKLNHFKDAVSQDKNRERSREKNKDRGQSL